MKWENENIKGMVEHINGELKKGRKLEDISISDFNVNYKSIEIRLKKEGYLMDLNKFIAEERSRQEDKLKATENHLEDNLNHDSKETCETDCEVDNAASQIDFDKLLELQNLIDPIKALLNHKEIINNSELPKIRYMNITQKTFKVDSEILAKWISFCKAKKGYKMQDLTSRALAEYMQRHGW